MLVKCEVPSSPTTREQELELVSQLALKGEDFETPRYRGSWFDPKCFIVMTKGVHNFVPINASLMWLSEYKQWYKPRNGYVVDRPTKYEIHTDHWDPQPIAVTWADLGILYHVGPDGLARVKLGLMDDKLAQLKAKWS